MSAARGRLGIAGQARRCQSTRCQALRCQALRCQALRCQATRRRGVEMVGAGVHSLHFGQFCASLRYRGKDLRRSRPRGRGPGGRRRLDPLKRRLTEAGHPARRAARSQALLPRTPPEWSLRASRWETAEARALVAVALTRKCTNVRIGKRPDVNAIRVKQPSIHAGLRAIFHVAGKPALLLQRDLADIAVTSFRPLSSRHTKGDPMKVRLRTALLGVSVLAVAGFAAVSRRRTIRCGSTAAPAAGRRATTRTSPTGARARRRRASTRNRSTGTAAATSPTRTTWCATRSTATARARTGATSRRTARAT